MKKLDVGQTLQLVGNAGVIFGILLLVYELNQNRAMMQAQMRSNISDTLVDILVQQANNPQLMEAYVKREMGEPLSPVEEQQIGNMNTAFWRYRENVNYQYRNGFIEDSEYLTQREVWVRAINSFEAARDGWCERQEIQSSEFVEEINSLLDRPCE